MTHIHIPKVISEKKTEKSKNNSISSGRRLWLFFHFLSIFLSFAFFIAYIFTHWTWGTNFHWLDILDRTRCLPDWQWALHAFSANWFLLIPFHSIPFRFSLSIRLSVFSSFSSFSFHSIFIFYLNCRSWFNCIWSDADTIQSKVNTEHRTRTLG